MWGGAESRGERSTHVDESYTAIIDWILSCNCWRCVIERRSYSQKLRVLVSVGICARGARHAVAIAYDRNGKLSGIPDAQSLNMGCVTCHRFNSMCTVSKCAALVDRN